jgi:hypothetical protein
MSMLRKYGGVALLLLALLIAAQVGVSFLVKTHRMRGFLIAHLESAFGRPVQAGDFSLQILPMPELDVDSVWCRPCSRRTSRRWPRAVTRPSFRLSRCGR